MRRSVLTAHIIASVGLLGDSAGFLAVAIRAATTDDPALAAASYELLEMFSVVFGIPLSMISLATGITLGMGTKWGVLRHSWVTAKLVLVARRDPRRRARHRPVAELMQDGAGGRETTLIVASAAQVFALALARQGCRCSSRAAAGRAPRPLPPGAGVGRLSGRVAREGQRLASRRARSMSRLVSRSLIDSRLSKRSLPLASAISTFARPPEK